MNAAYLARLSAWLERHKRYPETARMRGETGAALLLFRIDGTGRVISYRIVRSSGNAALDRAVLQMISRANPVPRPPGDIAPNGLTITVPVVFRRER